MRNKMICIVPIISYSDDWESDTDSSKDGSHCDKREFQEKAGKSLSSSLKAQYEASPESMKERNIVLNKETTKRKLCRDCRRSKWEEAVRATHAKEKSVSHEHSVALQDLSEENTSCKTKDGTFTRGDFNCQSKPTKMKRNNTFENSRNSKNVDEGESSRSLMKPVAPFVRKHIYKGISHDGNGRAKYLNLRYCTNPEDRYYHPVTSSMNYGWTWGYPPEIKAPDYGKKMIILTSFFRPSDTQLKPRDDY